MEIEVLNPEPTYIKLIDVIDPCLAEDLIDLVKSKGKPSNYATNVNCLEYRIPNVFVGNMKKEEIDIISSLHTIIDPLRELANDVFKNTALSTIVTHAGYWVMEYSKGGTFEEHVDYSLDSDEYSTPALATLVINLNGQEEYSGGEVFLSGKKLPSYYLGGQIWDGWTYHEVKPITSGKRYVLVVHFTGLIKQ